MRTAGARVRSYAGAPALHQGRVLDCEPVRFSAL